ncbi:FtsQ-type POTRA domain-containing protein [Paenibacillus timonensis]|jgi:cell division protein FtsQ|uniref:Cell division protein DivIB n=1 Tax=Paenibacillus timonensis TaxID=225915 RepID=A0ABW3S866_9BACL|nr:MULTISPECIES: FtsQ-type POTRA domain-containing protein [Paenibacillus]MCH1640355.1 FtsQ-type POTRA domain-containing protein [Paenibacillus timonensis]MDU2239991.1 FtsQ-type POTRA domain-containing protein [Paenibacillus sp.]
MPKANVPVLKEPAPKKKSGRKIKTILILLFLALLCVLFFRSSLSKISVITFEGNTYTTEAELLEVTGLQVGSPFFAVSADHIARKLEDVSSVKQATVDKTFPGSVNIRIEEYPIAAYELTGEGKLQGLLANGTRIGLKDGSMPVDKPILTGWKADDASLVKLCRTLSQIPDELTADISEIVPSPTMSYPDRIKLYTRSKFEIISAISLLAKKAEYMNEILQTQDPGKLTMLDADSYVPYSATENEDGGQNDTTHE